MQKGDMVTTDYQELIWPFKQCHFQGPSMIFKSISPIVNL